MKPFELSDNRQAALGGGSGPGNRHSSYLAIADAEVAAMLSPSMAREAVRDAFLCHARGDYVQPLKPYLYPRGRKKMLSAGRFIAMPGYLGDPVNMAGIKWIGSMPANIDCGLPRASGLLILNDPLTALPVAVVECATLSARRTAAMAALAVAHLAPEEPLRVAIIGAGPIGEAVVDALADVCDNVIEIRLHDLRGARAEALANAARDGKSQCIITHSSAKACVCDANVVITATTGAQPGYLKLSWLSQASLIIPLSLDDCEPAVLLAADKVIVDDWDQSNREEKLLHRLTQSGAFSRNDLYSEFGQIVAGNAPGREGEEMIYFNAMGQALLDISAGASVFRASTRNP